MEPEPAPAAERPRPDTRRLHPSSLLFDAGRRFASLAFWALAAAFLAARSDEVWYLVFLLPPIAEALIRYVSFRYAFGSDQLEIREGVLVRSVRHVPYARIQNIDTVQGPLHRLLGVVEVRLETASGSEPEGVFRVISSAQLGELRARVFGGEGAPATADEAFRAEAVRRGEGAPFFRMRTSDVALFGLLSQKGLVLIGGAFVALRELSSWERLEERLGAGLEQASEGARDLGAPVWIALAILLVLVVQLGSVVWAVLTLHGFRIERRGEDLITICGLFTRQTSSLSRARVQFLDVRQSVPQRCLARVAVRALSAGGDSTRESQVARKWLVPLCRRDQLAAVLAEVQPEADFEGVAWRSVHPRAWRRLFVRWTLALALPVLLAWSHSWVLGTAASLAALLLALVLARLRARALGWGVGTRAVFLRDGLLSRRLACVRFEKIQSLRLTRTPFDRRAGMASLSIDTAGAPGTRLRFVLPYLALREGRALLGRLEREAASVRFRW